MYIYKKKNLFLLLLISFCSTVQLSCDSHSEADFKIILVDSGELVISEHHVKTFSPNEAILELNEEGIKHWNSFIPYQQVPKLADSLFSRDFIIVIEGREIGSGKFWSALSSESYPGLIILESINKLDNENNRIYIQWDYPVSTSNTEYTELIAEITRYFEKHNMLR